MTDEPIRVEELCLANWDDWLEVMGPKGGDAGCFCMFLRQTTREFDERRGDTNRDSARNLIEADQMPGLIGYRGSTPIGWVQIGPRSLYSRVQKSRVTKPIDDRAAWAVTCFVIPKQHRRQGVATTLLEAAVGYACEHGAEVVEGYPMEPRSDAVASHWAWMGFSSMFDDGRFVEVARRSPTRPFMRREC